MENNNWNHINENNNMSELNQLENIDPCLIQSMNPHLIASMKLFFEMKNNNWSQINKKNNNAKPNQLENVDPYLLISMQLFFEEEKISTSILQRKLSLGYSRAIQIMDTLEELGYISEMNTEKNRTFLITKDEFEKIIEPKS